MSQQMRANNDAVIITYYVESPAIRSHHQELKRHPFSRKPQIRRKLGSDRRSELLAYANDLRTDSQHLSTPRKRSKSKPNRWKWCSASASKFQVSFLQICQGNKEELKYKRMTSEDKTESDPLNGVEGVNSRKEKSSERSRSNPHFCRKLKSILKELVFGCHRNKGWKRG